MCKIETPSHNAETQQATVFFLMVNSVFTKAICKFQKWRAEEPCGDAAINKVTLWFVERYRLITDEKKSRNINFGKLVLQHNSVRK